MLFLRFNQVGYNTNSQMKCVTSDKKIKNINSRKHDNYQFLSIEQNYKYMLTKKTD